MKINNNVMHLRNAIETIVSMLASRKMRVTQMGMQAYVLYHPVTGDAVGMNIPHLPDDASDELIEAVQGFIDHEVGHLLHTDPSAIIEGNKKGPAIANLQNLIEDPRIEGRQASAFKGAKFNLANTGRFVLKTIVQPSFDLAKGKGASPEELATTLMMPAIRALCGQEEFVDFMSDKWDYVKPLIDKIPQSTLEEIRDCRDTAHALEVAVKLKDIITSPPPPPPPQQSKSEEKSEESQGGEGEGEGKGEGEGESSEPEKGGGEEQPGSAKGKGGEGEEQEQKPQGDPGKREDQSKGEGEDEGHNVNAQETGAMDPNAVLKGLNNLKDYDKMLAEAVTARAMKEGQGSDYLIFTKDEDRVSLIEPTQRSIENIKEMEDEVGPMVGPMAKELERVIIARSQAQWTGGHRRGKLHGASLARLRMGRDDVFRRKTEVTTKQVAFELLVDDSGSMHGDAAKIITASYSAFALASMLDRLQIPNESIAFTTRPHSQDVLAKLAADPLAGRYCRKEALNIMVMKEFSERVTTTVKARFVQLAEDRSKAQFNIDGEALMIAYRRLMARKEPRKCLIVLSDGRPAGRGARGLDAHLRSAVQAVTRGGVELFGIGICDQSVSNFYPRHAVVSNIEELPRAVMGELRRFLLENK